MMRYEQRPETQNATFQYLRYSNEEAIQRMKNYLENCKLYMTRRPEEYSGSRKQLMEITEDLTYYMQKAQEQIEKACELCGSIMLANRKTPDCNSVTTRWIFDEETQTMHEATLEECAEKDGITPLEYLAREAEELKDLEEPYYEQQEFTE